MSAEHTQEVLGKIAERMGKNSAKLGVEPDRPAFSGFSHKLRMRFVAVYEQASRSIGKPSKLTTEGKKYN